ncbi:hypothetical protein H5410_038036 [Solanum commersonii]|uniref:Uncharacterized protein n=1 Tax=Solanum commersonii TaxID=4109 RepID=A0A9J5YBY1_SOLCO|nr:hypothetical protein H5410_038036 [Solanum commersonii]
MCKKQLMIPNSDFMENMEKKFLNLVSKLEEKDNVITTFKLLAELFAEVKRKEMEQGTPLSLLPYTNNFHNNNLAFHVKPVPERRLVTVTVSTISSETCYEAGDNMMNYSTGNKKTTLININDVPHNVCEGFLHARTSRQTITTTTTVTPHLQSGINLELELLSAICNLTELPDRTSALLLPVTKDSQSKERITNC